MISTLTYLHGTRRFILAAFPYSLVYTTDGRDSLIVAIAHARRRPGYWKARLVPQDPPGA